MLILVSTNKSKPTTQFSFKLSSLLLFFVKFTKVLSVEVSLRAADLQPRNFNYHPFEDLFESQVDQFQTYLLEEKVRASNLDE